MQNTGDNIFILILIAIAGGLIISFAVFYFILAYIKKSLKHKEEVQRREMEYQAQLFKSIVSSQEEERRLIGKELHDEVSSVLYALKLRIKNNIAAETGSNLEAIDKLIVITRNISHLLSPPEIEMLGFHDSLKELCATFSTAQSGLQIHLADTADGFIPKEKFQLSLMLYRVIQELITNTVKHAHATQVTITIKNEGSVFYITYEDNGTGMKTDPETTSSLGLKNITSRLLLIKAEYRFVKAPGFRFELWLNHATI